MRNVRHREETKGLFGGERRVHAESEVRVASAMPTDVEIDLLLRVPIPEDDGAKVEVSSADPATSPYTGEPDGPVIKGGLRQRVRVPAGAEVVARLHHHLTTNAKYEIEGGDRRG